MATPLTKPPQQNASDVEWQQWLAKLYNFIFHPKYVTEASGDANADISAGVGYHGVTALTTSRTKKLPATGDLDDGAYLVVQDESGTAGSHNIVISCQGSDKINGSTSFSITANYGRAEIIKRGANFYAK